MLEGRRRREFRRECAVDQRLKRFYRSLQFSKPRGSEHAFSGPDAVIGLEKFHFSADFMINLRRKLRWFPNGFESFAIIGL